MLNRVSDDAGNIKIIYYCIDVVLNEISQLICTAINIITDTILYIATAKCYCDLHNIEKIKLSLQRHN